jgi:hypothetical protein
MGFVDSGPRNWNVTMVAPLEAQNLLNIPVVPMSNYTYLPFNFPSTSSRDHRIFFPNQMATPPFDHRLELHLWLPGWLVGQLSIKCLLAGMIRGRFQGRSAVALHLALR